MEEVSSGDAVIRVFLVDDHELIRRGVRDLLDVEPDIEVVGEAGTAETRPSNVRIPPLRCTGELTGHRWTNVDNLQPFALMAGTRLTSDPQFST